MNTSRNRGAANEADGRKPRDRASACFLSFVLLAVSACDEPERITRPLFVPMDVEATAHPAGNTIIFARTAPNVLSTALVRLELSTGATDTLLLGANLFQPAWSPSGAVLAFTSNARLAIHDPEDGTLYLTPDGVRSYDPAWVNDSTILFSSDESGVGFVLWKADTNSGEREPVWPHVLPVAELDVGDDSLAVAAVLYPLQDPSPTSRIVLLNLSSGDTAYLTPESYSAHDPVFHPTEARVAYVRSTDGSPEVWEVDLETKEHSRLISNGSSPAFLPSGTHLLFSRLDETSVNVWLAAANGSNQRQLTHPPEP